MNTRPSLDKNSIRAARHPSPFVPLAFGLILLALAGAGKSFANPAQAAAFGDVPPDHWAFLYIEALSEAGYVAGCQAEPRLYCPASGMTRAEAAVFVVRGVRGSGFLPAQPATPTFADVPLAEWFAKWARQLWDDGYTAGCGADPLIFCPLQVHTRAEAIVFFLRMLRGKDYQPGPPGSMPYSDVPGESWYGKWVAAAYHEGLTADCEDPSNRGDALFRPLDPLTRAEAACMMVKAKLIPIPTPTPTGSATPTPSSTPTPTPSATPRPTETLPPGGDLCAGLITDKAPHPITTLPKPPVGQPVRDPEFGATIRRITDVGEGGVLKPMYSTIPAWNADESYLILYHTRNVGGRHELYDGRTYQFIKVLDIRPADLEQVYWHTSDPAILFYVDIVQKKLIRYNVDSGVKETVHTFACPSDLYGGSDPMFTSWDSNVFGLLCRQTSTQREVFAYNLATDSEGPRLLTTSYTAPQPGPGGALFYFDGDVLDFNMNVLRSLDLAKALEHGSLGRPANGHDTYYAVAFDGSPVGSLIAHDLTDGSLRVIIGPDAGYPYPPSSTHISAVSYKAPGWVFLSSVGDPPSGQTVLNNELYLADTNPGGTGKVCRIAHHRSWAGNGGPLGYWAEPHVVGSPSGTRLLFGSDWGGGNSVDTYVIELPSYRGSR